MAPDLPATMPAAVLKGLRDVVVEDRPLPEVGPEDVLVEVSHCGVCGSDLHFMLEWGGRPDSIGGHEYTGTVVATGRDVGGWRVGDEVVGGPAACCETCEYCRAGRPSLCSGREHAGLGEFQGAFARYVLVHRSELLRVPEGLSLRHAALAEPMAVALHGITRAGGPRPGTRWLVTGGGPIGYLSVAALVAAGVTDIVVSEPHASRRVLCEQLGARTVTPDRLEEAILPMEIVDEPFDVVLECSGKARAMETGLAQLERTGTLVLVGAGLERPQFDPNRILLNELVVTGAYTYDEDGFPAALELLASGRLPLDLLVEPDDVPLDGLLHAAEQLASGERPAKVMIVPRAGAEEGQR